MSDQALKAPSGALVACQASTRTQLIDRVSLATRCVKQHADDFLQLLLEAGIGPDKAFCFQAKGRLAESGRIAKTLKGDLALALELSLWLLPRRHYLVIRDFQESIYIAVHPLEGLPHSMRVSLRPVSGR